jgi:hypothetical protein
VTKNVLGAAKSGLRRWEGPSVAERGADLRPDALGQPGGNPALAALEVDQLLEGALIAEVLEAVEARLDVSLDDEAFLAGDLAVEVEIEAF